MMGGANGSPGVTIILRALQKKEFTPAVRCQGGEIRVAASMMQSTLLLQVSDDGPGFDAQSIPPGHGLENLQERLTALFNGGGGMEIARRDHRSAHDHRDAPHDADVAHAIGALAARASIPAATSRLRLARRGAIARPRSARIRSLAGRSGVSLCGRKHTIVCIIL